MKPRTAWPVLAKKAQEKSHAAQMALNRERERFKQLQVSRERMVNLYADYLQRSRDAEGKTHNMVETMNARGFMRQIQQLIARVDSDLQQAAQHLQKVRDAWRDAEKTRIKLETLMQEDLKRVDEYHRKREQRDMDTTGVMLHNLKH